MTTDHMDPIQRDALNLRSIEIMQTRKARLHDAARRDVNVFATLFRDEEGNRIKQSTFHRKVQAHFMQYDNCILMAPPGHGKTISAAIRVLWEIGRRPSMRVGIMSATSELGDKILGMMSNNIEMNEDLHRTFPHLQKSNFETWGERRIQIKGYRGTKKDYTVETAGVGKKIYGARYDLVILDDIIDLQNSSTAGQRQKIVDWHDTMLLSRLMRGDREWIIGTPWNKYDAYHVLAERGIPCFKYPVESKGVFLWPEQWDAARLAERKRKMTNWRFYQQYYMMDASPDASPFDIAALEACYVPDTHWRCTAMVPADWQFVTGVDLGIQKKKDSDRTVFVTLATDGVKKLVIDIRAGKWGMKEKRMIAEALHRQYGGVFVVESNAAQALMVEVLRDYTRVPVMSSTTKHGTKINDEWGIPSLAIDVENGRWQIPALPTPPLEVKEMLDEAIMYNPAAHTGDILMACYLAYSGIARIFRGGISASGQRKVNRNKSLAFCFVMCYIDSEIKKETINGKITVIILPVRSRDLRGISRRSKT